MFIAIVGRLYLYLQVMKYILTYQLLPISINYIICVHMAEK